MVIQYRPASKKRKIVLTEFLASYIGFSVALESEAPCFLVVYENLSLALLLMCFLLAGRYCSVAVVNWMKLAYTVPIIHSTALSSWMFFFNVCTVYKMHLCYV